MWLHLFLTLWAAVHNIGLVGWHWVVEDHEAIAYPTHVLQEDEPGWDCRTMGNHVCGNF